LTTSARFFCSAITHPPSAQDNAESDHAAYLVRSVNNKFVGASRLTSDFLGVTGKVNLVTKPALEAMVLFRHPGDGSLFAIASHLTGWEPNPLVLLKAHRFPNNQPCGPRCSLSDPDIRFERLGNPTAEYSSYNSQPTFVAGPLADHRGQPFLVLLSDNRLRAGPRGLPDAGYVWLPLEFHGNGGGGSGEGVREILTVAKRMNWTLADPFRGDDNAEESTGAIS